MNDEGGSAAPSGDVIFGAEGALVLASSGGALDPPRQRIDYDHEQEPSRQAQGPEALEGHEHE